MLSGGLSLDDVAACPDVMENPDESHARRCSGRLARTASITRFTPTTRIDHRECGRCRELVRVETLRDFQQEDTEETSILPAYDPGKVGRWERRWE